MRITTAKTAGFCFGVDRAVRQAYALAAQTPQAATLGQLIHNPQVTEALEARGVRMIDAPADARPGETVLIRAHGAPPETYRALRQAGAEICDATCPFVKKIHQIVAAQSDPETPVFIAGNPAHPEVRGIVGYCRGPAYVFPDAQTLETLLRAQKTNCEKGIIFVSQTTFSQKAWKNCKEIIKNLCTNPKIFDTICSATRKRQEEAERLSEQNDAMIVIGGRHSSNTAKLAAVCSEHCPTFLVERAQELRTIDLSHYAAIGVTAGASTPAEIIKEVLLEMAEILNETTNLQVEEVPSKVEITDDMDFSEALEASLSSMSTDQKVKGVVMGITPTEIQVDIGRKHAGFVPLDEYSADPNADASKELKIGDELDLIIMKTNDAEGTVMLSKRRFDAQKSWMDIIDAEESGAVLEGVVTEIIKGGVLVVSNGVRVFIPASLATERRDEPLEDLLKQTVKFRIIEVNKQRRRAVGSVRAVLREAKKEAAEAFWAQAEVGQKYHGVVKSMTNYGAFVDIGGVDGMVHISEMSWRRIKHPSDVFSVGQEVDVYIKALDAEKRKISLGYRRDEDNPWEILKKNYPEGTVIETEIVGLTTFGAFAKVIPGIDGLIHISQIADRRINKPEDVLAVGDKVTCKITAIDFEKKRVSLSIRALLEAAAPADEAEDDEDAYDDEEAPAEEAPAEEAPVEEAPVEEAPAEEVPAEEAPAEEAPVEEAPAEEAPAEEAPADAPADAE
ncbi:MAG: bifunctional 4-hydroxy-3-methylbut-2-enyl diphosphate reductase/30S ribosomal protein S1 [Clostridia bacterium]|nr:bifunctional 4-hydroxy-3-methylbut-2-enyl diphosphate reductase/30S ribosomal protein S1 [Clostridia bacterium]